MTGPVRVLLVAPALLIVGGQSVQADRLIQFMEFQREIQISLLPLCNELKSGIGSIRFLRTFIRSLQYWTKLLLMVPSCDILHVFSAAHSAFMIWTLPALAAARLFKKKIVLHHHDGRAESHLNKSSLAVWALKAMDAVVVPSPFLQQIFLKFEIHAEAIGNIADQTKAVYRRRRSLRPVLIHNRMMERHYNIECTLRAFGIVQQQYPNAVLLLAGDGPQRQELERLAIQLRLQSVYFVGVVPYCEMPAFLDRGDIYITTTDVDNMPLSVLESYVSGLPVVATRVGGIPWIAENEITALLVEPNSPQAAADAVIRLLNDPALAESLAANALKSAHVYSGSHVAQQWTTFYLTLVGKLAVSPDKSGGRQGTMQAGAR